MAIRASFDELIRRYGKDAPAEMFVRFGHTNLVKV